MKWTGKDVANLMRAAQKKYTWNSGSLANRETNCAVGMLARALGMPQKWIGHVVVPQPIANIFGFNDGSGSLEKAAKRIEEAHENGQLKPELPVADYERMLKDYAEACGEKLTPDCELLEEVKRLHEGE